MSIAITCIIWILQIWWLSPSPCLRGRHLHLALSLRRVEREDPAFPILSTWPLRRPTDWLQLVNQPQTEAEVAALRGRVKRGRPFGDPNWVTDTAKRLGLESTARLRGRPKKQS